MADPAALTPETIPVAKRRMMFLASCMALIATAMSFAIRGDIANDLTRVFQMTEQQTGWVLNAWAWGFAGAILFGGPLCDILKMGRVMLLAFVAHAVGCILTISAPSFPLLFSATLTMGIGNGLVEAAINPLVATVYHKNKVGMLNTLHAWFPGGIVIGSIIAWAMTQSGMMGLHIGSLSLDLWQAKMAIILVPVAIYGVMFAGLKLPETERVTSGVTAREMWQDAMRPAFLMLLFCMMLTAATELGPNSWMASVMSKTAGQGVLVLAWISIVMCICRFFAGPLAHAISPPGIMVAGAALAAVGLWAISFATGAGMAYGASFIFGLGVCFFWPTMLGMASERFPKTGAVGLGLVGCIGNVGAGFAAPIMGRISDVTGQPELSMRYITPLPIIVLAAFLCILVWDRSRGGYKIIRLTEDASKTEE